MSGKYALKTANDPADTPAKDDDPPAGAGVQEVVARAAKHPAAAPTAVTLVAIALVMGLGWLNRTGEAGPTPHARPLAEGSALQTEAMADGDPRVLAEGQVGKIGDALTPAEAAVVSVSGDTAVLVPSWLDIPLVAPAAAVMPDAPHALIPGAVPATIVPGSGSGGSGGSPGSGNTGTTRPNGSTGPGGTGSATTTTQPSTTPTTSDDTTPSTEPPTTEPPTTEPPTTEPPTTEPPTTEPPTTDPPVTTADPASSPGLLDAVGGILDEVTTTLEPLPLL